MKNRILSIAVLIALFVSVLGGCSANKKGSETEGTNNTAVDDWTPGELLTLPANALTSEFKEISDAEGRDLNNLFKAQEDKLSESTQSATNVKAREWSKYSAASAKAKLSSAEATLYDRIYAICEKYINNPSRTVKSNDYAYISYGSAKYSDLGLSHDEVSNVFWWFKYNNPQFYFCSGWAYTSTDLYVTVYDFVLDLDDQGETTNAMFERLDSWIAQCSDDEVTDWDKIISANRIICENIIYSPAVKSGDKTASSGKNQSMYSVLMTDDTVCSGYAQTFTAMANALGVDTYTTVSITHAWNAARFGDGSYYFIDVCWNDEDNGYNEDFIGVGTDYAASRDQGENHHIYEDYIADFAPSIPKTDYDPKNNIVKIAAPSLRIGGSGNNIVKVEWNSVSNAEKYEYSVLNGSQVLCSRSTEDNFLYAVLPSGVGSATVKVHAVGTENGNKIYSANSEITINANASSSGSNQPANISIENTDGIYIKWDADSSVDGWLFIAYGEDGTFTEPVLTLSLSKQSNSVRLSSVWQPENYNYFSVMSVTKAQSGEAYSSPAQLKYSTKNGMQLVTSGTEGSGSSYVTQRYGNGYYVGEIANGKRHGHGTYYWNNGDVYEGEWKDGEKTGQGKLTRPSGDVYEGEWKDNHMNGQGKYTWACGDVFEGTWVDDVRIGQGKYTWANGNVYIGEWQNSKMNGQGKLIWTSGSVYEGNWVNDVRSGQGKYTWANGDVYVGEYKDNKMHGHGKLTYANGTVEEGEWKDGEFIG